MPKVHLTSFFTILIFSCFGQADLVKDISTSPSQIKNSSYNLTFTKSSNLVYFPVQNEFGNELWESDGTTDGTHMIVDLNPGSGDGIYAGNSTSIDFQDKVYFSGNDGVHGAELWSTDGTKLGTKLVKNIYPGIGGSSPHSFFQFKDKLAFIANDNVTGFELWTTDGSDSGTELLFDLTPGIASTDFGYISEALNIVPGVNKFFFFIQGDLWQSDGTSPGTNLIMDFDYPGGYIRTSNAKSINDVIYFSVSDNLANLNSKIWRSDGTQSGTYQLENFYGSSFTSFNGKIIFSEDNKMRITDGTPFSSQILSPSSFTATMEIGDNLYALSANSLIKTDGTPGGTLEIPLGAVTANALHAVNNKIILPYNVGQSDWATEELGMYDADTGIVTLLKDIHPGSSGSMPNSFIQLDNKVIFASDDGEHGFELWYTDGTASQTKLLSDTKPGTTDALIMNPVVINEEVFFLASNINNAGFNSLWKTTDNFEPTLLKQNLQFPKFIGTFSGAYYYCDNLKIWKTSATGSQELFTTSSVGGYSISNYANSGYSMGGKFFFFATVSPFGGEPWVTDGTPAGTHIIKDIRPGGLSSVLSPAGIDFNDRFFFSASDGISGAEIWVTDGTEMGTTLLKDLYAGAGESYPQNFVRLGNNFYFTAYVPEFGRELWKSDGTPAGTMNVTDIFPGSSSSQPTNPLVWDNKIFFFAQDNVNSYALWQTEGAENNTTKVKSFSARPENLTAIENKLYFSADDGIHGKEVWISDGTEGGTTRIEIMNGPLSSSPSLFTNMNGVCYFMADNKIWKSSGTKETTKEVSNLQPTTSMVALHDWIYFGASTKEYGNEFYRIRHKQNQSISFTPLPEKIVTDVTFTITATASSGLPVSFSSSSSKISLWANQVTILNAGRVTITANQPGAESYDAALPINQSFCINPIKPAITTTLSSGSVTLTSNSSTGNQWFLNGNAIAGASNTSLEAQEAGFYKVQVSADDCKSEFSSETAVVVTGDIMPEAMRLTLYPNPTNDFLIIQGLDPETKICTIIDAMGKPYPIIMENEKDHHRLSVGQFSEGIYLINIQQNNKMEHLKFVKK